MKTKLSSLLRPVAALPVAILALAASACTEVHRSGVQPPPQMVHMAGPEPQGPGISCAQAGPEQCAPGPQVPPMNVGPRGHGRQQPVAVTRHTARTGPIHSEGPPAQADEFYRKGKGYKKYLLGANGEKILVDRVGVNDEGAIASMRASGREPISGSLEQIDASQVPSEAMEKIQREYQALKGRGQPRPAPRPAPRR